MRLQNEHIMITDLCFGHSRGHWTIPVTQDLGKPFA